MTRAITLIAVLLCAAFATISASSLFERVRSEDEYQLLFRKFVDMHHKYYSSDEVNEKYNNFKDNFDLIEQHNAGNHKWKMAMNQHGDLSAEQFKERKTAFGFRHILRPFLRSKNVQENETVPVDIPSNLDWRTKGVVTDVKNQGDCGSCYAFSATGAIESHYAIKTGELVTLAEQQFVDCSWLYGNNGCGGGLMDQAFEYAIDHKLCLDTTYPYKAKVQICRTFRCWKTLPKNTVSGYVDVKENNETALLLALLHGPVSVAVQADDSGFQFYSSGVFDGECGTDLNHGVLLVGYGEENGTKYWLVKNSWGANWGENGYIKLVRHEGDGAPGQCGIAMVASYPKIGA